VIEQTSKWKDKWILPNTANEPHALESCFNSTIQKYPVAEIVLPQVYDLLGTIANLTKSTSGCVVNSDSRQKIVNSAKDFK
jgi:hypothetical protein